MNSNAFVNAKVFFYRMIPFCTATTVACLQNKDTLKDVILIPYSSIVEVGDDKTGSLTKLKLVAIQWVKTSFSKKCLWRSLINVIT